MSSIHLSSEKTDPIGASTDGFWTSMWKREKADAKPSAGMVETWQSTVPRRGKVAPSVNHHCCVWCGIMLTYSERREHKWCIYIYSVRASTVGVLKLKERIACSIMTYACEEIGHLRARGGK